MPENSLKINNVHMVFEVQSLKQYAIKGSGSTRNSSTRKIYDRSQKNYIFQSQGSGSKIVFPKEQGKFLHIPHRYLVLKVLPQQNFSIQLLISDKNKTARRVIIGSKESVLPQICSVKMPTYQHREKWVCLQIDLWSFMQAFQGQKYQSLMKITINGGFRMMYIFAAFCKMNSLKMTKTTNLPKALMRVSEDAKNILACSFIRLQTLVQQQKSTIIDSKRTINHSKSKQYRIRKNSLLKSRQKQPNISVVQQSHSNNQQISISNIANFREVNSTNSKGLSKSSCKTKPLQKQQNKSAIQKRSRIISLVKIPQNQSLFINLKGKQRANLIRYGDSKIKKKSVDRSHQSSTLAASQLIREQESDLLKRVDKTIEGAESNGIPLRSIYSDVEYLEMSQRFSTITQHNFFRSQYNRRLSGEQKQINNYQQSIDQQIQEIIQNERSFRAKQKPEILEQANSVMSKKRLDESILHQQKGFEQAHYNQFVKSTERPFSPSCRNLQINKDQQNISDFTHNVAKTKKTELQLFYDPILNCYYDFKRQAYYELKA